MVSFSDFKKLDLRIGKVIKVEEVEGLDKLYKLSVDLGEEKHRTILAGVKEFIGPQDLEGKSVVIVANLEPKEVKGVVSEGMLLAADPSVGSGSPRAKSRGDEDGRPILLTPEENVAPGTVVH